MIEGGVPSWPILILAGGVLCASAYTDLKDFRISNLLILALAALFLLYLAIANSWSSLPWNAALALGVFVIMLPFYTLGWIGGGDVKLVTVAYLWAGLDRAFAFSTLLFMFVSLFALAARMGWMRTISTNVDRRPRIAFAPSIAAALIAVFILSEIAS